MVGTWELEPATSTQGQNCDWTQISHLSYATLRAFVVVFRAVLGFFLDVSAVFLALCDALAEDGNSILGCFAVRW